MRKSETYGRHMLLNIIGNIEQTDHREDLEFNMTLSTQSKIVNGKYGCSCWWLPLGRNSGLKIFNSKRYKCAGDAVVRMLSWECRFDEFMKKTKVSRAYIPDVFDYVTVCHTGLWERGGSKRFDGENDRMYYAAVIMRRYEMPAEVPNSVLRDLEWAFKEDGIKLHRDTFRKAQLGILDKRYVVLDIADINQMKFL